MIITKDSPLAALSMDLKRISMFIQNKSFTSAERFNQEAQRWLLESRKKSSDRSIRQMLDKIDLVLKQENDLKKAEDCLMYSTLLQKRAT